jgi:hypothetical protein
MLGYAALKPNLRGVRHAPSALLFYESTLDHIITRLARAR